MTANRILWVDALKSFAIIIVVLGHCLQEIDATSILYKYIYAFHMPLFMTISGYCSYKPSVFFTNIGKRFFQLVIPFFAWPMVWYVVKMDFSGVADYYMHLPLNPDTGLWFLYVLFLISLVDFVRSKTSCVIRATHLVKDSKKLDQYVYELSIVGTIILLLILYWTYKHVGLPGNWISFVALYYPYYMLGCMMRKHNERLKKHLWWLGSIGMIVYFLGTYFLEDRICQPFLALGGIMSAFLIFRKWCNRKMPRLVLFTGMSTLGIYAVHQPIIHYVMHIIRTPLWTDIILTFVLTYIISIVVVRILKMSKLTRFLLLGINK